MKSEELFGVKKDSLPNLVSALLCAAVGMVFISIGLQQYSIGSYGLIPQMLHLLIFQPLYLSSIGFGFVFLVSAIFFIRQAFIGGIFAPGTSDWPSGSKFCILLVVLWLVVYLIMKMM